MNDIALISSDNFNPDTATIESILLALAKYGYPRLTNNKRGWYCSVEMFVTGKGVEFEIKSEFTHGSPINACRQCYGRLIKTLKELKK